MASLELGKLSSYDLLLSESTTEIYYAKLTDSLYKVLEEFHHNKVLFSAPQQSIIDFSHLFQVPTWYVLKNNNFFLQNKGQIQLTVNKQGRGGNIQVFRDQNISKHSFKSLPISNKTGLDCLKQTRSNPGLTVVGWL